MLELEVLPTVAGPVLRFEAAQMELRSAEAIRAEGKTFELTAREGIVHQAGGSLKQEAARDLSVKAVGDLSARGRIA